MTVSEPGDVYAPATSRSLPPRGRITMPHMTALDGLRALAIIMVYLSHSGLGGVVPGGLGVTIFFFLSGFLITSLLRVEFLSSETVSFRDFYVRRALRIIPPLWLSMAFIACLVVAGIASGTPDTLGVLAQALFGINYAEALAGAQGLPGMPLWSLAVEEHFYFVFPLVFLLMVRRTDFAGVAKYCAAACAVVLMIRCYYVFALGDAYNTYFFTHTRIDSILFGCILAMWQNPVLDEGAWRPDRRHVALALAALVGTIAIRSPFFRETIRYSIQGVSLFVLFSAALWSTGAARRVLAHPVLRRIGLYSYTIYLVHFCFLLILARYVTNGSMIAAGALGILPTWAYAAGMYRFVERPLAAWRRRMNAYDAPVPLAVAAEPR